MKLLQIINESSNDTKFSPEFKKVLTAFIKKYRLEIAGTYLDDTDIPGIVNDILEFLVKQYKIDSRYVDDRGKLLPFKK